MLAGAFVLIMAVGCCCGAPAGVGAATIDCERPPDPEKDPAAYARWVRECKERRRDQVVELMSGKKKATTESVPLVSFRL